MAINDGPDLYCAYSILHKVKSKEHSLTDKQFAEFMGAMHPKMGTSSISVIMNL